MSKRNNPSSLYPQHNRNTLGRTITACLLGVKLALLSAACGREAAPEPDPSPTPTEASVNCAANPKGIASLDIDTATLGRYAIGDKTPGDNGAWQDKVDVFANGDSTFTPVNKEVSRTYSYDSLPADPDQPLLIFTEPGGGVTFGATRVENTPATVHVVYLCSAAAWR